MKTEPLEIISSGLYTFIRDPRYSAEYMEEENTWVLRITKVEYKDSAIFDCQVNTDPLMSYTISLKVIGKNTLCITRSSAFLFQSLTTASLLMMLLCMQQVGRALFV